MKKAILLAVLLWSCDEPRPAQERVVSHPQSLPKELEGLKIYWVPYSDGFMGGGVYVATMNGHVNSATYQVGKSIQSTIVVSNTLRLGAVLMENDSMIVFKKETP